MIKDHKILVKEFNLVFNSYSKIYDMSKNFNVDHLNEQHNKFKESIVKTLTENNVTHD